MLNLIGIGTVLIGGSVLAAVFGWPFASVAVGVLAILFLIALIGGFKVNQATESQRDEALGQRDEARRERDAALAARPSERRGIDLEDSSYQSRRTRISGQDAAIRGRGSDVQIDEAEIDE